MEMRPEATSGSLIAHLDTNAFASYLCSSRATAPDARHDKGCVNDPEHTCWHVLSAFMCGCQHRRGRTLLRQGMIVVSVGCILLLVLTLVQSDLRATMLDTSAGGTDAIKDVRTLDQQHSEPTGRGTSFSVSTAADASMSAVLHFFGSFDNAIFGSKRFSAGRIVAPPSEPSHAPAASVKRARTPKSLLVSRGRPGVILRACAQAGPRSTIFHPY